MVADFLVRTEDDLRQGSHSAEALIREVVKRHPEIRAAVRAEADEAQEASSIPLDARLLYLVPLATVGIIIWTVAYLMPIAIGTPTTTGWWLLGGSVLLALAGIAGSSVWATRELDRWSKRRDAHLRFDRAVADSIGELLRKISFEWDSADVLWGEEFISTHAPTLVGIGVDNAGSSKLSGVR